ncbi:hypothetical protein ACWDRB_17470 [Nonomuraea sp. NPDC003707]
MRSFLLDIVTRWRAFPREQIVIAQASGDLATTLDADDPRDAPDGDCDVRQPGDSAARRRHRDGTRPASHAGPSRGRT